MCAGHEWHPNVKALHPPIDSLLLNELYRLDVGGLRATWKAARKQRWSMFDSPQYQRVIEAIRAVSDGRPMWMVETHWRGFQ